MPRKAGKDELVTKEAAISKIAAAAILKPKKKASTNKAKAARTSPQRTLKRKATKEVETTSPSPIVPHVPITPSARRPLALSLPSPFRFPMDVDRLMSQVARVSGVAFVILGAIFTLGYTSALLGNEIAFFSQVNNVAQTLSTASSTLTAPINTVVTEIDSAANELESFMVIDQQAPLRGTARVTITTPQAHRVEVFMFTDSWQDKESLGFATQVASDRWVYNWDTTRVESGRNYRISAHVWDRSTYTATGDADFVLQLEYMLVDNSVTTTTTPIQTVVAPIIEEPPVTLSAPATLTGASNVSVGVVGATAVSLVVEHKRTGSRNYLYNATRLSPSEWRVNWQTGGFADGEYSVRARVTNQYGTYVGGALSVTLDNEPDAVVVDEEETDDSAVPITDTITGVTETIGTPTLPTLRLRLSDGGVLDGTERIEADMSTDAASHVYFYIRDSVSAIPRFIGTGTKTTGSLRWYTNWYTNNTPNGTYQLFARAITLPGPIDSQTVRVTIANAVDTEVTAADVEESTAIESAVGTVSEETSALKEPTSRLTADEGVPSADANQTEEAAVVQAEDQLAALLSTYREKLDAELIRLGSAHRAKDEAAVSRITLRIMKLVDEMVTASQAEDKESLRSALTRAIEALIEKYTAEVDRVSAIIAERNQTDILKDSDRDGISDFDEVTLYNTNPLVADTDNDGFTDGAEILSGYDPLSDVRESIIAYESPKDTGVYREDLLVIDTVAAITTASSTDTEAVSIKLAGRALPNSFATLYIFSTPVIVTVKTDAEGAWEYRFDQELEDGQHNVYVGITDNAGRIVAKSQPFGFIKEAQAITPNQAAIVDNSEAAMPEDRLVSGYAFAAIVSISVVAIGLVLILLGLQLDARRRRTALTESGLSAPV